MKKEIMIQEILMAVNAQAKRTKGTQFSTKKSDGDLFFTLAFQTEKQLIKICKTIGIKIN